MKDDPDGAWVWASMPVAGSEPKWQEFTWRSWGSLGAYLVDQSTFMVPARPEVIEAVRRMLDETRRVGRVGQMRRVSLLDRAAENRIIAEMKDAIDAEYAEVLDRLPMFSSELEYERKRGRVIYAEVEESEVDLERFRRWMSRIAARDYFDAPLGADARAAVEAAAEELAAFRDEAMGVHTPEPDNPE
ncbi:Chromate resistance protein ChrB [Pseudonocardia spinosispora]|uniref:Chromate resistance protein ChrB n=1 Tax=Pseudonocardia spinosispora TaxID=103441 RepID=UPI00048F7080